MAKKVECPRGTDKHHIFPKALGGSDNPGNIACLKPEKHQQVHSKGPKSGITSEGKKIRYDPRIKPYKGSGKR